MTIENEGITNFLKQFTPLLHKTLQRLNIKPQQMDYEDYFQELQIKLLQILQTFQRESTDREAVNSMFTAYAGKGLYWHGLDLLRKKKNHSLDTIESEQIQWLADQDSTAYEPVESSVYTDDFFRLAKERLSPEDFTLLIQIAERKHTMEELARKHGVVRATIYQRKKRIQTCLADIKDCLLDYVDK